MRRNNRHLRVIADTPHESTMQTDTSGNPGESYDWRHSKSICNCKGKIMKNIVVRNMVLSAFALLAVILAGGSLSTALAQGSGDRAIDQAQRAVRQRIITQEGGRNLTVLFNTICGQ